MRSRIKAWHLWVFVGAAVVVAELVAPPGELLSEGVDRALEQHPLLTRVAIEYTARHLMNDLPPQVDLFTWVARLVTRLART
ncbi:DUF7427 family protein [Nocardia otitidiscaviarum]|uniref:DUF7427 family protein n=1 Tax=Nocardia otitidiscaviarum TaxID=1823 RepID=UPI0005B871A1|nr:hypothetical protein [Nocardia otitidiscaviarum]